MNKDYNGEYDPPLEWEQGEVKLLLSYIEQLQIELEVANEIITMNINKINKLENENQQLKKQKDKIKEYLEKHFQDDEGMICKYLSDNTCEVNENFIDEISRMLGEIDEL